MSDIQDAAPSSTEPVAQAGSQQAPQTQEPSQGNAVGGVSDLAAPVSSGTTVQATDTPSSTIGETQTNQSSNENPSTTSSDGTAGDVGNADTGASCSPAPAVSSSVPSTNSDVNAANYGSQVTGQEAGDAGNAVGKTGSADSATPTDNAPLSAATADAVATFADLMDQFETRQYPNGVMMRTLGELPKESPVSYPRPEAPADNSPHGLLNQIEAYFTTALRSSRTDGHKLIAQLRSALSQE
jgi:hypothetical protein